MEGTQLSVLANVVDSHLHSVAESSSWARLQSCERGRLGLHVCEPVQFAGPWIPAPLTSLKDGFSVTVLMPTELSTE